MAQRTSEELLAQREAWLARKAARDAGEDIPKMPPLKPGETPPEPTAAAASPESAPEPEPAPAPPEPVAAQAAAAPEAPQPAPQKVGPQKPAGKRTPEEIRAQREAFLARKAAKAAGQAAPAQAPAATKAAAPAAAKPKPAAKAKPAAKPAETIDPNVTRRELLNYAWLASIALFSLETVGFSLWFAFPNFKAGTFGGTFDIGQANEVLPEVNSGPVPYTDGKFWLVNLDTEFNGEPRKGVIALYKVCTHLGCLYEWVPMTGRFECPCHGSKFALTGDYLAGPARRSLDRFVIQAVGPDGQVRAQTDPEGDPLIVNPDDQLVIDTGNRILGSSDIVPA